MTTRLIYCEMCNRQYLNTSFMKHLESKKHSKNEISYNAMIEEKK